MATFLNDTFSTGTSGTAIPGRTGEVGATWTRNTAYGSDLLITDSGRARGGGTCADYASGLPNSAEYDITAVIRCFTVVGNMGVTARMSTGATDTMYVADYNSAATQWRIAKVVAGTLTSLATASATLTAGTDYTLRFEVRDATKTLFINGSQVAQTSDNAITAAGRVGLRGATNTSNTTGLHVDSITAADPSGTQMGELVYTGDELKFKPIYVFRGGVLIG